MPWAYLSVCGMTDHGPALPAPHILHQRAREIEAMARRAADFALPSGRQDIGAVLRQMKAIAMLAGDYDA